LPDMEAHEARRPAAAQKIIKYFISVILIAAEIRGNLNIIN